MTADGSAASIHSRAGLGLGPLALADGALLVGSLWLRPAGRAMAVGLAGVLVTAGLAVAASQVFAATPPITGENGKPVPGSIATLEKVSLNGSEQWISIRGVQ